MLKKLIGLAMALVWTMSASQSSACADIAPVRRRRVSITDDEYMFQSAIAAAFQDDDSGLEKCRRRRRIDGLLGRRRSETRLVRYKGGNGEPSRWRWRPTGAKSLATPISATAWSALDMLSDLRCAVKTIINVSGDGKTIAPKRRRTPSLYQARQRAERAQRSMDWSFPTRSPIFPATTKGASSSARTRS